MDRIRNDCFRFERMYLRNVSYGCKEIRPALLRSFDGDNTCEFFWCIQNIMDTASLVTGSQTQNNTSLNLTDECLINRRNWTVREANEEDEHLDPELLKLPLAKLLKLELEVLYRLRHKRKKLATRFLKLESPGNGVDRDASGDDTDDINDRVVEKDKKVMDLLKTKLHKYKTLLEYQTLLSAAIEEKFVSDKIRFTKNHHTLLTMKFSTLLSFVQSLAKIWETEFYRVNTKDKDVDSSQDSGFVSVNTDKDSNDDLQTSGPYIKTKAYGIRYTGPTNFLPGLASFLGAALVKMFIPDRNKRCKVGIYVPGQYEVVPEPKKETDYSIFLASSLQIDRPKIPALERSDVYLRVVKDFTGEGPLHMSLKAGQVVKQKIGVNSEGMAYGWSRSHKLGKKRCGFYPADCVVEEA